MEQKKYKEKKLEKEIEKLKSKNITAENKLRKTTTDFQKNVKILNLKNNTLEEELQKIKKELQKNK